jgi:predicted N-acyltransferase
MLKVNLHQSTASIDPARWDSLGSDPLSTHAVLTALEGAALPGVHLRYATVEDRAGRPVAAAPIARIEVDGRRLTHGLFRRLIGAVRTVYPQFLRTSLMVCGTPLSVGNPPLRLAHGVDAAPVLAELAGLLDELGAAERAPWLVFKEFSSLNLEAARTALSQADPGWLVVPSEPNSAVRIEWRSYDEYLASLRSAYRYKIRSAARKLAREGIAVDVVPLGHAYDDTLHALYEAVVARAAVQLERLTPEFFTALGRASGTAAPLIRFSRDGTVIGWIAMLFAGETAYDLFHGIDYAQNESTALYFNQLAEVVRLAIERRARYLSLGQSTEIAKARFGGQPVPLWAGLRHRNAAFSLALRGGRRALFPAKEVPQRHVFRSQGPAADGGDRVTPRGDTPRDPRRSSDRLSRPRSRPDRSRRCRPTERRGLHSTRA